MATGYAETVEGARGDRVRRDSGVHTGCGHISASSNGGGDCGSDWQRVAAFVEQAEPRLPTNHHRQTGVCERTQATYLGAALRSHVVEPLELV